MSKEVIKADSNERDHQGESTSTPSIEKISFFLEKISDIEANKVEASRLELDSIRLNYDIKNREIDLDVQKDNHSFEFGLKQLATLQDDKADDRAKKHKERSLQIGLVALIALLLSAFIIISLFLDKDQIAIEAIKFIGFIGAGAFGGYGAASLKKVKKSINNNDD
jgi:hypothetical protein